MKKKFLLLSTLFIAGGLLFSCSSDNDNSGIVDPVDPGEVDEIPFSSLSPEEIKTKLSKDGKTYIDKINDLGDNKGAKLFISFSNKLNSLKYDIHQLQEDEQNIEESSDGWLNYHEYNIYLKDIMGKYVWTNNTHGWYQWEKIGESENMEFTLPSRLGEGKKNDGTIIAKITPSGVLINKEEMPKKIEADLRVNKEDVGNFIITAEGINPDTFVEKVVGKLNCKNYVLDAVINKKDNKNTSTFSLTKTSEKLIWGEVYSNANINSETSQFGDKSTLVLNLFDSYQISGIANLEELIPTNKKIREEIDEILYDSYGDLTHSDINKIKNLYDKIATNTTEHTDLYLMGKEKDGKITKLAKVEFYTADNGYEGNSYWEIEERFYTSAELMFGDKTRVDIETYFGTGFNGVLSAWEKLFEKFY